MIQIYKYIHSDNTHTQLNTHLHNTQFYITHTNT